MMLLENELPIDEIVVMVQKRQASAFAPRLAQGRQAQYRLRLIFMQAVKSFDVPRESFMPSPKVDSVVIKLVLNDEDKYQIENKKNFSHW